MTGCNNDPILEAQVGNDDHAKKHCSHGTRYDEPCEQCESDDQQEIAGEYIKDDRIPDDPKDAEEAEYQEHLEDFDTDPDVDEFQDDPDSGLEDLYYQFGHSLE